jgi:hypothetical protein
MMYALKTYFLSWFFLNLLRNCVRFTAFTSALYKFFVLTPELMGSYLRKQKELFFYFRWLKIIMCDCVRQFVLDSALLVRRYILKGFFESRRAFCIRWHQGKFTLYYAFQRFNFWKYQEFLVANVFGVGYFSSL